MKLLEPGTFTFFSGPVIHLKSSFLAIKEKYVGQPLTKVMREELYQELEILFDRFDLKDLQVFIKQKKEDPHTIEIIPVRTIDKWALRGILLTDEINDEDI